MQGAMQRAYANDTERMEVLAAEDRLCDRRVHDSAGERRTLVAGLLATPASIALSARLALK